MLIVVGIIINGTLIFLSESLLAKQSIRSQIETKAREAASDIVSSLQEYPAYRWLLIYWAEHTDDLEIEYDASFAGNTLTREKCELLLERYPGLALRYCDEAQLEAMDPEDQKLYAEIVYAWMITRIDDIKRTFGCSYLFVVMTDTDEGEDPYGTQLFLMSAADPDSVRGTEYEQVYTLGVTVNVKQDGTREAMREAVRKAAASEWQGYQIVGEKTNDSGRYRDFYCANMVQDGKAVLTGLTYYQGDLASQIRRAALLRTAIAALYLIILINLVIRRIIVYLLRPLESVAEEIRAYKVSKDSRRAEENLTKQLSGRHAAAIRQNEIGQLAEDFIGMTKEIDTYTNRIELESAARERIEYELEMASQIQIHMLPEAQPEFPEQPEFLLSASMTPAREVGGDFYDYFLLDDRHLVMVIADVSDKGIPAALFMVQAKLLIKSRAMTGESPNQILTYVNQQLNENNEKRYFVSVWLGIIDLATGEGIAANAGHEHPAFCRKGENFELVVYKHDLVLGLMPEITYRQHRFRLLPGDRLFVYTDGVPEASNDRKEQFGTERMLKVLNDCRDAEPKELLEQMGAAIDEFAGDAQRFDDTTMMCLWYKGT